MTTHNPSSEAEKADAVTPTSSAARNRSFLLLGILILLLGALWYDYKVARPQVEAAYESVGKMNDEYNLQAGKKYLTDKEVQRTLNRMPARTIDEGHYHVEVYSYRSGLPIRSHNYYAVYMSGTPMVFVKHYKYELPMEELQSLFEGDGPMVHSDEEIAAMRASMERSRESAKEYSDAKRKELTPKTDATEAPAEATTQQAATGETPATGKGAAEKSAADAPTTDQPKPNPAAASAPTAPAAGGEK